MGRASPPVPQPNETLQSQRPDVRFRPFGSAAIICHTRSSVYLRVQARNDPGEYQTSLGECSGSADEARGVHRRAESVVSRCKTLTFFFFASWFLWCTISLLIHAPQAHNFIHCRIFCIRCHKAHHVTSRNKYQCHVALSALCYWVSYCC
jgi:hypothetical protein